MSAALTAKAAGLVGCTRCGRVHRTETPDCIRCGAPLSSRDENSLQRVWAWWWAGLIAYVPANLYPMLLTSTLVSNTESTIVGGAVELFAHGDVGVALIVLIASVVIPIGKFMAIGFLALFGYNICDVAKEVQENVKSSIESMTGLRVVEINVHVGGVTFKPSASAEEKAEPAPSETEAPAETADAE